MTPIRVLFALTEDSKRDFLSAFDETRLPGMNDLWVDVAKLDATDWARLLFEFDPEVVVSAWRTPGYPIDYGRSTETSLRYVCHLAGTVREYVLREMIERGVLVTNWGDVASGSVAEHAVLLTLGALRNTARWRQWMEGVYRNSIVELRTRSLCGKRVGIHGFGAVARKIVAMLKPFDVELSAYSEGVPSELFEECHVRECSDLRELFASSEVLIECEALTPRTRQTIGGDLLRCLPQDAVFVNVGRGAVVDEGALAEVAASGAIRIALDVFTTEPLPKDAPLRNIPNALLSPHIAGPAMDALPLCGEFGMRNLACYLSGNLKGLKGLVTLEIFDRST